MSELDILKERKDKIVGFLSKFKEDFSYLAMFILVFIAYKIRISNLPLLKDVTNGNYIPGDPDAAAFLRYAKYVLENGSMMANDLMRYYPLGYNNLDDFNLLSHFIVYLYKFMHFFNSSITLEYVDVIFPAITFSVAAIFFYLLVKKLFNYKVALLSTAFLIFSPQFLYRTISGVGDKEALGIVFFFAAFYFYILALKSKHKYGYLNGLLAGLSTALLGATWGGVNFIFLIIGGSALIKIIFDNFKKKEYYSYALWWLVSFILLNRFYNNYYGFQSIAMALTSQVTLLALITGLFNFLINDLNILNLKEKLKKYPIGLVSLAIASVIAIIFIISFYGQDFIYDRILNIFIDLTRPFSRNRWALTVAESQQPFVNSWFGNFGSYYLYLFLLSSFVIFYECFKNVKKYKWELTIIYSLFITSFIFSRYSSDSILNGKSTFSLVLYIGSLISFAILILGYFIYGFYKDKELYESFKSIDKTHIFLLIWFLVTAIGARSAIRLVFVFVPVTTVLVSYILIKIFDYGFHNENKLKKISAIAIVAILIFAPFVSGSLIERAKITIDTAKRTGPSFDQQWQMAMKWVRENTPKDSVFAHWWDYGYWVQTFGERATISDGGNARGAINHFVGRHLLTGRNRTEALELLKTHNVSNLLIVSDEIGKYTAFSSIGADENYDRYSYIPNFFMNPEEVQEARDEQGNEIFNYLYRGTFVLDEDFIFNGKLFPKSSSAIAGVILTMQQSDNKIIAIKEPAAILVYQNTQQNVPLNCVFINNQEYKFPNENGYDGCLRTVIVVQDDGQINPIGGALFLSPNTKNTLFSQLYLFDKNKDNSKEWEGFEKIYDDSQNGYTLAFYPRYGRIIGPLKIWKVTYSKDIKSNPAYLKTEVPNPDVEKVKEF